MGMGPCGSAEAVGLILKAQLTLNRGQSPHQGIIRLAVGLLPKQLGHILGCQVHGLQWCVGWAGAAWWVYAWVCEKVDGLMESRMFNCSARCGSRPRTLAVTNWRRAPQEKRRLSTHTHTARSVRSAHRAHHTILVIVALRGQAKVGELYDGPGPAVVHKAVLQLDVPGGHALQEAVGKHADQV